MSSAAYSIQLEPRRSLRGLLICCGAGATLAGLLLIVGMPVTAEWRTSLAVVWIWQSGRELRTLLRGAAQVLRIRLDSDGALRVLGRDGDWHNVSLGTGSLVLPRCAWLRLRLPDGSVYAELLCGSAVHSKDWHGLQLIWRQRRSVFGGSMLS